MVAEQLKVDVLVVGGGMAGMSAAVVAATAGAEVAVVEKGPQIGGSAAISAGILWTAPDYATLREHVPDGDPELGRVLVGDFAAGVAAVRATGAEISAPWQGQMGFGLAYAIDVVGLLERWRTAIESARGWVIRNTAARRLLLDGAGGVRGAVTMGVDGLAEVEAGAVILATGGFQGDPALLVTFLGSNADRMPVRSNPHSVGDGFRMATSAGAAASRALGGFYGHLLASPIDRLDERLFLPLTQYHSNHCILVNRLGRRFIDESRGDEHSAQALLRQPEARGVLLADERVRRTYVISAPYEHGGVVDRFAEAAGAGARFAIGDTVDDLVEQVAAWGIPSGNLRSTIARHTAASAGERVELDASLPPSAEPLVEAPFYALEVQPAITFPNGGLRVDVDGRVLDRDGRPIQNLYAAGADAGGLYNVGYAGGLAAALVFGRRAGHAAVAARGAIAQPA